jgi:hypothetical protein
MSHPHDHAPAAGHGTSPFTASEVETLHTEDVHAGTAIVGLMLTIFVIGVVGYLLIAYWVA